MTTPSEPDATNADPVVLDLRASVADMRSTARWIVGAAAAAGSLLLAGGPLTVVGKLHHVGDAVVAAAGLLMALLGVAWAIHRTSQVLTPRVATFDDLGRPALRGLRELIDRSPGDFYGPFTPDPVALQEERTLRTAVCTRLTAALVHEDDATRRRTLEHALAVARGNASLAERTQRRLLTWIHAWQVREALRTARRDTFVASLAVVLGAALFFTAPGTTSKAPAPVRICISTASPPPPPLLGDPCAR
ncbi:hypothetical protein [Streptomyces yangpuensis]|uniref:hypothetical protein n=1 Tax=Streptomyces yangpuensis TaxID=1648182 RepID=UPI0035DA7624